MRYLRYILPVLLLIVSACDSIRTSAPLLPVEDFFKNPEKTAFHLSPGGKYISYLAPYESRMNLFIIKEDDSAAVRITSITDSDIDKYFWVNDDRLIYIMDEGGNEEYRLYAINCDGSSAIDITPADGVAIKLISLLRDDDEHILASFNINTETLFDVYKLNVYTGEIDLLVKNPGSVISWIADNSGEVRVAISSDVANMGMLYRKNSTEEFSLIKYTSFTDSFYPLRFTPDNKYMYVASSIGRDKTAIIKYDPDNKKEIETVYSSKEADVNHVLISRKTNEVVGVKYNTSHLNYELFTDYHKNIYDDIAAKLPGMEFYVTDLDRNEQKALLKAYSDKSPGEYYLYEVSTNKMEKLANPEPWINPDEMADMKPVSYISRDGLKINGYLTVPKGRKPHNLPVVVLPHGGPWLRDYWGFDPDVQFLANRGYAVLQINFRGSTGFGKAFHQAGYKEWGGKIIDDISDGVHWLINQEIADSNRIGIYGFSFGGYAAIAGLAFTPELYRCGVSYAGLVDIFSYLDGIPPKWQSYKDMMYKMVGDPASDSLLIHQHSPIFYQSQIDDPLFVAMGANDPRVSQKDMDILTAKLKKRGLEVIYMVKGDEGHGYRKEENRLEFYSTMEKFLAKNLGGKVYN
ncbi:MAG: peptidase [Melioribacteraceae bacterium]|nr:MAG: peptidase [Melioribacteraceae bacterium]